MVAVMVMTMGAVLVMLAMGRMWLLMAVLHVVDVK